MIDIYKASAGSGKTYRLTYDYLRLMLGEKIHRDDDAAASYRLRRDKYPRGHRSILAITFTNKATEEMKHRILHELGVLAGMEPEWKDSGPYTADLCRDLNTDPDSLRTAARSALKALLYDFSNFNVSTIDAFFQQVLRTFAHEADLSNSFDIELDRPYAIRRSVQMMYHALSQLRPEESRTDQTLAWITRYMLDLSQQGRSFNIFNARENLFGDFISSFDKMLSEDYTIFSEQLGKYFNVGDPDPEGSSSRLNRFIHILERECAESICRFAADARQGIEMLDDKIVNKKAITGFSKWVDAVLATPKDADGHRRMPADPGELSTYITNTVQAGSGEALIKKSARISEEQRAALAAQIYDTAMSIARGESARRSYAVITSCIFLLGMTRTVLARLEEYCADNNIFLLSDTNELLRSIIADDEIPFVYERMGIWLNHFLIDEFQDTSRMQWSNLRPLLAQSHGERHDSLIIGDEKQCIYRFRNSDPSLLHSQVQTDFGTDIRISGSRPSENTNWRSAREIVRFNNTLFTALAATLPPIAEIYANVAQQISPKNASTPGYVRCTAIPVRRKADFEDLSVEIMVEQIRSQLARGYRPGQICVLTRRRAEARRIISHLSALDLGCEIESEDSFSLSLSQSVRFIVSVLSMIAAPDHSTTRGVSRRRIASMLCDYEHIRVLDPTVAPDEAIKKALDGSEAALDGLMESLAELNTMSLVSLVERIIKDYITPEMQRDENAFISAFQDIVVDYCDRGEGDISGFLEWWSSNGDSCNIAAESNDMALKVMTIHKSKGLEFDCVHVPFVDFLTVSDPSKTTIDWWRLTPEAGEPSPYLESAGIHIDPELVPPLIPLKRSASMLGTPFERGYRELEQELLLDEINSTYVAFTRASRELIVQYQAIAPGKNGARYIGTHLDEALGAATDSWVDEANSAAGDLPTPLFTPIERISAEIPVDETDEAEPIGIEIYTVGSPTEPKAEAEKPRSVLTPVKAGILESYGAADRPEIWATMTLEDPDEGLSEARLRGTLMHRILARVRTADDLEPVVAKMEKRGTIAPDEAREIVRTLGRAINSGHGRRWFTDTRRVLCERPILSDARTRYPDRVVWTADGTIDVIDYKFGEPSDAYHTQVRRYMRLLAKIYSGETIRGFLWYIDSGTVEQV